MSALQALCQGSIPCRRILAKVVLAVAYALAMRGARVRLPPFAI
jgi:hypothetical protein